MGLRITNAKGENPTVWVYGTIGDEYGGFTVGQLRETLSEIPKHQNFDMRIYSDGGSFYEAMSMYSLIDQRRDKVHGIVDGLAASAASLLFQAAGKRSMHEHSSQMIHEVHGFTPHSMRASEFRKIADQMDGTNRDLVAIYSKNWKGSDGDLLTALADETWLSAEQSVEVGLADEVVSGAAIAARVNVNMFNYQNIPDGILKGNEPFIPPWHEEREKQLEEALK